MEANQLTEITAALRNAMAGGPDTCATFEVRGNPDKWIQFVGGLLNCAYPGAAPPDLSVMLGDRATPLSWTLDGWEPTVSATFEVSKPDVSALTSLIEAYFERVLWFDPGRDRLDIRLEEL